MGALLEPGETLEPAWRFRRRGVFHGRGYVVATGRTICLSRNLDLESESLMRGIGLGRNNCSRLRFVGRVHAPGEPESGGSRILRYAAAFNARELSVPASGARDKTLGRVRANRPGLTGKLAGSQIPSPNYYP